MHQVRVRMRIVGGRRATRRKDKNEIRTAKGCARDPAHQCSMCSPELILPLPAQPKTLQHELRDGHGYHKNREAARPRTHRSRARDTRVWDAAGVSGCQRVREDYERQWGTVRHVRPNGEAHMRPSRETLRSLNRPPTRNSHLMRYPYRRSPLRA